MFTFLLHHRSSQSVFVEGSILTTCVMLRYEGALERRSKILDIIRSLDLPNNPLDDIIDQVLPYSLFGNPSLCVDSGCSVYLKKC